MKDAGLNSGVQAIFAIFLGLMISVCIGVGVDTFYVSHRDLASHSYGHPMTSVILIACATFSMAIALMCAARIPVISNGLLLGGVFTMFYGIIVIFDRDESILRFWIMLAALVITLGLGYIRFTRIGKVAQVATAVGVREGPGLTDIERRVQGLEQRMNEAARAFGPKPGDPGAG